MAAPVPTTLPPYHYPAHFREGPAQVVIERVIDRLKAIPVITTIFGDRLFDWAREDIPVIETPAMALFDGTERRDRNQIAGVFNLWVLASPEDRGNRGRLFLRAVVGALYEIFDTTSEWFTESDPLEIPGLRTLGQVIDADFSKAYYNHSSNTELPLAALTIQWSVDLELWRQHLLRDCLERDLLAEKLEILKRIVGDIDAYPTVEAAVADAPDLASPDFKIGIDTTK